MEKADHELISQLIPADENLKKLYSEHQKLEKAIRRFESFSHYSPTAALKNKELKKEKLRGVDSMMKILNDYRKQVSKQAA